MDEQPTYNPNVKRKRSARSSFFRLIFIGLILGLGFIIYQNWYLHATSGEDPYDEIFIQINGYMPQFARDFACGKIADRFPGTLPPFTCEPQ